jgi:sulfatase maturation enzyme AslB (radical SAM superfamily)
MGPILFPKSEKTIFLKILIISATPIILSIDPEFTQLTEERFPGRDLRTLGDELVHRHGSSSIKYGRGSVLNMDLTNRCNMMCTPCFANANQAGVVYELTLEEIKCFLDRAISFKPRRQMSVQFTGGEPTISPHFLDACRYAKKRWATTVCRPAHHLRRRPAH